MIILFLYIKKTEIMYLFTSLIKFNNIKLYEYNYILLIIY